MCRQHAQADARVTTPNAQSAVRAAGHQKKLLGQNQRIGFVLGRVLPERQTNAQRGHTSSWEAKIEWIRMQPLNQLNSEERTSQAPNTLIVPPKHMNACPIAERPESDGAIK